MRVKTYPLLERCIEEGIKFGIRRAFKHTDDPLTQEQHDILEERLFDEITNSICEYFSFEGKGLGDE